MKPSILIGAVLSLSAAMTVGAADASPKEAITAAAKKLGEKANYSWRTTTVEIKDVGTTKIEVPEEARKKLT